jgi:hypothetical protein
MDVVDLHNLGNFLDKHPDSIEILCNNCKSKRFFVLKPDIELPKEHYYFSCTECIREKKGVNWGHYTLQ